MTAIDELVKRGHFLESPDGVLYAYVNANWPAGGSELRVVNSASGRLVAAARFSEIIGPLQWTEEGLATKEANGTLKVRVRVAEVTDRGGPGKEPNAEGSNVPGPLATHAERVSPAPAQREETLPASQPNIVTEFTQLRDRYVGAKTQLRRTREALDGLISETRKQQPELTVNDAKKRHPTALQAAEEARKDAQQAERLYVAKLELLKIDLRAAERSVASAQATLERLTKLHQAGLAPQHEVDEPAALLDEAEHAYQRARTVYELFRSISDDEPTPGEQAQEE